MKQRKHDKYKTMRHGFCLGCGKDVGLVEVSYDDGMPPPNRVPAWCDSEKCQEPRRKMRELANEILTENE